jgi:hypothetical protein
MKMQIKQSDAAMQNPKLLTAVQLLQSHLIRHLPKNQRELGLQLVDAAIDEIQRESKVDSPR